MKKIRLLIADDHELILKGIRSMLQSADHLEIIGEAANGSEAIEKALLNVPDVIFMDISMPGISGIEACAEIIRMKPGIKVIALSQHEDEAYVYQILKAGGSGYMLKNSTREEFITAIKYVMAGEKYFSSHISDILISDLFARKEREPEANAQQVHLTKRETEIIRMITGDLTNQKISEQLHISLRTVETHRRNIMQKLNLKSAVSLVRYAIEHRLIGSAD